MRQEFSKLMQQVQEMQNKMQVAQEKMASQELLGEAGAGLVKITLNGQHEAKKVELDASVVPGLSVEDKEMLQDLIVAAINSANNKIKAIEKSILPNLPIGFDALGLSQLFKGA